MLYLKQVWMVEHNQGGGAPNDYALLHIDSWKGRVGGRKNCKTD